MIAVSHGENTVYHSTVPEWGTSVVPAPGMGGYPYGGWSWAGRLVSVKDAAGLAAVAACIRLLSGQIAGMPFAVYDGIGAQREPVPDSWQHELLDNPSPGEWNAFTFMEDVISSGEATQNAFIQKVKPKRARSGQPTVAEMRPLDPDYVSVRVKDGVKTILWRDGGKSIDITGQVLHIRGWALNPAPVGTSVISLNRNAIGSAMALEQYQGRYFQNDARPSIVIESPTPLNKEQRKDLRDGFNDVHQGSSRAHQLGILTGGATMRPISPALKDTQAVDLQEAKIREAARMFGIDDRYIGSLREAVRGATPEMEFAKLWRLSLFPRCRRVEAAFTADPDLFAGGSLKPRFDPTDMLRADTGTTATVIQELVQAGVITQNEGRAWLGMPRSDDPESDKLQHTPVGGKPNLDQDPDAGVDDDPPGGGDE